MVDIWPIFIRHPETAIGSERKAFAVDWDGSPARTRAAKPITCERSDGQDREAGVRDRAKDVGIETRCWGAIGTGEENGVFVSDLEVWS